METSSPRSSPTTTPPFKSPTFMHQSSSHNESPSSPTFASRRRLLDRFASSRGTSTAYQILSSTRRTRHQARNERIGQHSLTGFPSASPTPFGIFIPFARASHDHIGTRLVASRGPASNSSSSRDYTPTASSQLSPSSTHLAPTTHPSRQRSLSLFLTSTLRPFRTMNRCSIIPPLLLSFPKP